MAQKDAECEMFTHVVSLDAAFEGYVHINSTPTTRLILLLVGFVRQDWGLGTNRRPVGVKGEIRAGI